jgi:hypothetical protein
VVSTDAPDEYQRRLAAVVESSLRCHLNRSGSMGFGSSGGLQGVSAILGRLTSPSLFKIDDPFLFWR